MKDMKLIIDEKELTYEKIAEIKEHSKQYNYVFDKKEFLKNVGAYEQKLILLDSYKPYEVLNYLSELDLESSRLVINNLNYDEIIKILHLFTLEEKKTFYKNFPNLELVNNFIMYDEDAIEYVEDLSLERKVDLLDSSNAKTVEATSIVYESIPDEQKEEVLNQITTVNASAALNVVTSDSIESKEENLERTNEIQNIDQIEKEPKEENLEQKLEEKMDEKELELNIKLDEFLKSKFKYYKENIPGFEELNIDSENLYLSLPDQLKIIVSKDYELELNDKKLEQIKNEEEIKVSGENETDIKTQEDGFVQTEKETEILNQFTQVKNICELSEIQEIKNNINQNIKEETSKTK